MWHWRWWMGLSPSDPLIDRLIAERGVRYRPGMGRPDPAILTHLGDAEWARACRARAKAKARERFAAVGEQAISRDTRGVNTES